MISLKPYIRKVEFWNKALAESTSAHPYDIPAIQDCNKIEFHKDVTFFVGENGSGKSTLLEAIAIKVGLNAEGGTKWSRFSTSDTHSVLHQNMKLIKSPKEPGDHYFLRAESFYNLASKMDEVDYLKSYGGKSLHQQSHGESFLITMTEKMSGNGLYFMDEPEAALSPARQMAALNAIHNLVLLDSQLIIATHSPILLAYPNAKIYEFSEDGIQLVNYKETEHYQITKAFLDNPERMTDMLFK